MFGGAAALVQQARPQAGPAPQQRRGLGFGAERGQIVLPQHEITADQLFGVCHRARYSEGRAPLHAAARGHEVFAGVNPAKRCIVAGLHLARGRIPRR
jgi:hypothetical protein